jgi:hypothetical protein
MSILLLLTYVEWTKRTDWIDRNYNVRCDVQGTMRQVENTSIRTREAIALGLAC